MHIKHTPLYRRRSLVKRVPLHIRIILLSIAIVSPLFALGGDPASPYEQEFIITAYYSPRSGQCCYVKGGLEADKILNGEGERAADGTAVYPGMIAAPSSYAFGTRIALPGYGTFEVNDRGGAIQELSEGAHRLDIWVGEGEEGLARALTFGVKRIRGTVYPRGSRQPDVQFSFDAIPPLFSRLDSYAVDMNRFLALRPRLGNRGPSVSLLQEKLKTLGYFSSAVTGVFEEKTQDALRTFLRDYTLNEPSDALTQRTAATILAASVRMHAPDPVRGAVSREGDRRNIVEAQRTLRFLGYYRGKTDGMYSLDLFSSILKFQQHYALAGDAAAPGAGRIGPITARAIKDAWNRALVSRRAEKLLDRFRVDTLLTQRGELLDRFLEEGETGDHVELLQKFLADRGYFPVERISGTFGPVTRDALTAYQLSAGIIDSASGDGAGRAGPATLQVMRSEQVQNAFGRVREGGWRVL
ncbi:MAG: peptidoglycan-binding protein [Candidatus Peregrinibacteria bacterium]